MKLLQSYNVNDVSDKIDLLRIDIASLMRISRMLQKEWGWGPEPRDSLRRNQITISLIVDLRCTEQ